MRITLYILICFLLTRCGEQEIQEITDKPTPIILSLSPRDTCLWVLKKYAQEDTFLYMRYFDERQFNDGRISFVKTGNFIYPNQKTGVIIYASSDSLISVELYSYGKSSWELLDKKTDIRMNGLIFYAKFQDYDFDSIADIYVNTSVSNGLGLSSGKLLTVTKTGKLVLHHEASNIRDMEPDAKNKIVHALSALYCLTTKTTCKERYKWLDSKLIKISKPCQCND